MEIRTQKMVAASLAAVLGATHTRRMGPLIAAIVASLVGARAEAAFTQWEGDVNGQWQTSGNWNNGVPTTADIANFNASFGSQPNIFDFANTQTVGQLRVIDPGKNVVITLSDNSDGTPFGRLNLDSNNNGGAGTAIEMPTAVRDLTIQGTGILAQRNMGEGGNNVVWDLVGAGTGNLTINTQTFIVIGGVQLSINVGASRIVDIKSGTTNTSAAIIKGGNGTLLLNGGNLYTGATTVNAGTLGGNGSAVNSALTVGVGGTLAPGNSIGSLAFASADIDGVWAVEVDGTMIDQLAISGLLDLTAATIRFDQIGAPSEPALVFGTYGSLVGQGTATLLDVPAGYVVDFAYQGNQVALVQTIPGPASAAAGLALLSAMGVRRRRARR